MANSFEIFCGAKENALRRFFVNIDSIQAKYCQPLQSSSIIDLDKMKVVKNRRSLKQSNYQKFGHSHLVESRRKEELLTYSGDSAIGLDSHDSSLASIHQHAILNATDSQLPPLLCGDESVCSSYDPAVIHYRRDENQSHANITCLEDIYKTLQDVCDDPDISDAETLSDFSSSSDGCSSSEDDDLDSGNVADNDTATANTDLNDDNDDVQSHSEMRPSYDDELDGNVSCYSSRKKRDDFVFVKQRKNGLHRKACEGSKSQTIKLKKFSDEDSASLKPPGRNDSHSGTSESTCVDSLNEENLNKLRSRNDKNNTDRKSDRCDVIVNDRDRYDVTVDDRDSRKQLMNITYVVPGLTVATNSNNINNLFISKSSSTLNAQPLPLDAVIPETNASESCKVCSNNGNAGRNCLCVKDEDNIPGEYTQENDSVVSNQRLRDLSPVAHYSKHISQYEPHLEMADFSSSSDDSESDVSSVELKEEGVESISADSILFTEDALTINDDDLSSSGRNTAITLDNQKNKSDKSIPVASLFPTTMLLQQSSDANCCRLSEAHDDENDRVPTDTSTDSLTEDVILMDVNDFCGSHAKIKLEIHNGIKSASVSMLSQTTEPDSTPDMDSYKPARSTDCHSSYKMNGRVVGMNSPLECQKTNLQVSNTIESISSEPSIGTFSSRDYVGLRSDRKTGIVKSVTASPSSSTCKTSLKTASPAFCYKSLLPYSDVLDTLISPEFKALTPTASNLDKDSFSPSFLDKLMEIRLGMSTPTHSSCVRDSVSGENKQVKRPMTPRNILHEIQSMKLTSPSESSADKPKFHSTLWNTSEMTCAQTPVRPHSNKYKHNEREKVSPQTQRSNSSRTTTREASPTCMKTENDLANNACQKVSLPSKRTIFTDKDINEIAKATTSSTSRSSKLKFGNSVKPCLPAVTNADSKPFFAMRQTQRSHVDQIGTGTSSFSTSSFNDIKLIEEDILLRPIHQSVKLDRNPSQHNTTDPAVDVIENCTPSSGACRTDRISSCRNTDKKNANSSSKSVCLTKLRLNNRSFKEDANASLKFQQSEPETNANKNIPSSIVVSKSSVGSYDPDRIFTCTSSRNSSHYRKTILNNKCLNHDMNNTCKLQEFKTETADQDTIPMSTATSRQDKNSGKNNKMEPVRSGAQKTTVSTSSVYTKAKLRINALSNCKVNKLSLMSQKGQRETSSPHTVVASETSRNGRESLCRNNGNNNNHNTLTATPTKGGSAHCSKHWLNSHSNTKSKLRGMPTESPAMPVHIHDHTNGALRPQLTTVPKLTASSRNTDSHRRIEELSSSLQAEEMGESLCRKDKDGDVRGKDCTLLFSGDEDLHDKRDNAIAVDKHLTNCYNDNNYKCNNNNKQHVHFLKSAMRTTNRSRQFTCLLSRGSKILERSNFKSQLNSYPSKSTNQTIELKKVVPPKELLNDVCPIKKQYSVIDSKADKKLVSQCGCCLELETGIPSHHSQSKEAAALRHPTTHDTLSAVSMGVDSNQPGQIINDKYSQSEELKKTNEIMRINGGNKKNSNCDSFKIPHQPSSGMLNAKQMNFPMMSRNNTGDKMTACDSDQNCIKSFVKAAINSPVVTSTPYKMVQRGSTKVPSPNTTISTICCNESNCSTSPSSSDLDDDTVILESSPAAFNQQYLMTNKQRSRTTSSQRKLGYGTPPQQVSKTTSWVQKSHVNVSNPEVVSPYSYLFSPRARCVRKDSNVNTGCVQSPDVSAIPDCDSSVLPQDDHRRGHYDPASNTRPSTVSTLPVRTSCLSGDDTHSCNNVRNTDPHVITKMYSSEMRIASSSKYNAKFVSRLGKSKSDCSRPVPDIKPGQVRGIPSSVVYSHDNQSSVVYSFNMGSGSFKKPCCVAAKGNIHACELVDIQCGMNCEKTQSSHLMQQSGINALKRTIHGEIKPVLGNRNSFVSSRGEYSPNTESLSVYELPVNSSSSDSDISPRLVERYRHCKKRRKTSRKSLVQSFMDCENKNSNYNTTR